MLVTNMKPLIAYFSDRGRLFQRDRGRCFRLIVDAQGCAQEGDKCISKRGAWSPGTVREAVFFGFWILELDFFLSGPCQGRRQAPLGCACTHAL